MSETFTLTRRAFSRLLAVAPVASVPVAIAAAPLTLDEEIEALTGQLMGKLAQRWPDADVTHYPYSDKGCAFLLTAIRPNECAP